MKTFSKVVLHILGIIFVIALIVIVAMLITSLLKNDAFVNVATDWWNVFKDWFVSIFNSKSVNPFE